MTAGTSSQPQLPAVVAKEELELQPQLAVAAKDDVLSDELEPMDGKAAWIVVLGAFICTFASLGFFYSFGVFVIPYTEMYNKGRADVSMIYSVMFLSWHLLAPFAGRTGDYIGVKKSIAIGTFWFCLGLFTASAQTTFWHAILTQGFIVAIGGALTSLTVLPLSPQWFKKYRSLAGGIAVTGSGVGNFCYPAICTNLINKHGVKGALRYLGFIQFALFVVAGVLLKRRLPKVKQFGQPLDPNLLRRRPFRLLFGAGLFFASSAFVPIVHMTPFVKDMGYKDSEASLALSMFGVGSTLGRSLCGLAADRFGLLRVFRLSLLATAMLAAFWVLLEKANASMGVIHFWCFMYGFLAFAWYSLLPGTVALYWHPKMIGSVIGNIFIAFVPAAFSPMVAGYYYDQMGHYRVAQVYVPFCMFTVFAMVSGLTTEKKEPEKGKGKKREPPLTMGADQSRSPEAAVAYRNNHTEI